MAKMFYSLQEAASKLKKSEGEVRQMAAKGEITEFRDGDKLIFKVDQIDLLAGDDDTGDSEMSSMIPLADTGGASAMGYGLEESSAGSVLPGAPGASGIGSGLLGGSGSGSKSGSGSGMSAKERSGVPVFDVDELEEADPSAVTQVTDGGIDGGFTLDSIGSGSGLMDLTRESDDTSLGAEGLLDELYSKDEGTASEAPAGGSSIEEGSGLFESAPSASDLSGVEGAVVVMAEPYDGVGSGVTGGLAFGVIVAAALALVVVLTSMARVTIPFFASIGGEMAPLIWVGIIAGVTLLATGVGFMIGKKTA